MNKPLEELEQLKGLHLPPAISELPVAVGWWVLLLAVVLSFYFSIKKIRAYLKKNAYRKIALKQLDAIIKTHELEPNDQRLMTEINVLLKRVAIQRYPDCGCAAMHDQQWLAFLTACVDKRNKIDHKVFGLLAGIYKKHCSLETKQRESLLVTCRLWLKKHRNLIDSKEQHIV